MSRLPIASSGKWLLYAARIFALCAALIAVPCLGGVYTWDTLDGNWNNASNWDNGLPPSSNQTVLRFPNDASQTYTSTNDFPSGRIIEKIVLTGGATSATGTNVITGNLVDVRNSGNSITNNNSAAVGWDVQLDLGFYPPGNQLKLDGTGLTPATLSGNIRKSPAANNNPNRGIDKNGSTTWIVTGNVESTIDGPIHVNAGVLDLGGPANTFTGAVTVANTATLLLNGTHTGGGPYAIQSGGTLGGGGSTDSFVNVAGGGILAPGSSAGALGTGALTLANSSVLDFELDAPNLGNSPLSDRIDVDGDFTLDGILNVTALGGFGSPKTNDRWRLFNYTGSLDDLGLDLGSLPALDPNLYYVIDTATPGQVNLAISAPEPSTLLMIFLGLLGLALFRRRRNR